MAHITGPYKNIKIIKKTKSTFFLLLNTLLSEIKLHIFIQSHPSLPTHNPTPPTQLYLNQEHGKLQPTRVSLTSDGGTTCHAGEMKSPPSDQLINQRLRCKALSKVVHLNLPRGFEESDIAKRVMKIESRKP